MSRLLGWWQAAPPQAPRRDASATDAPSRRPSARKAPPMALRAAEPVSGAVERRGVLVCLCVDRNGNPARPEWTYWRDLAEARQARDTLTPCGPRCSGIHSCVEVAVPPRRGQAPA